MRTGLEDVYWGWQHAAKTFLALLSAQQRRPEAKHIACLHDDVYVHVPRLLEILSEPHGDGLYLGNAYRGHDFAGHRPQDVADYEAMHGHVKMPVIMKGAKRSKESNVVLRWSVGRRSHPPALALTCHASCSSDPLAFMAFR